MRTPAKERGSRISQWLRAIFVGCFVVAVTATGLFAYRYFTLPKTMTIAAGSVDGEPVRVMTAIAGRLTNSNSSIRLKIVGLGSGLEAAKAFSTGEADLAIVRADVADPSKARTVVLVSYGVVMIIVPPGSPDTLESLKGKTIGVIGEEINRNLIEALGREYDFAGAKVRFKDLTIADGQQAFRSREVNALLVVTPNSEKYLSLLRGIFAGTSKRRPQLVPIDSADAIANVAKAYESYELPKGSVRGSPPARRGSHDTACSLLSGGPQEHQRECDCRADESDHGCAQGPAHGISAFGAGERAEHRQGRIHSRASRCGGLLPGYAAKFSG